MEDRKANRRRRLWLQAGNTLARDPTARIACPTCGRGVLVVSDVRIMDETRVERWMRCDTCGSANTMLMTLEQAAGSAFQTQPPRVGGKPSEQETSAGENAEIKAPAKEFDWADSKAVENLVVEAVKAIRKKE